jgi:hypothetical protein
MFRDTNFVERGSTQQTGEGIILRTPFDIAIPILVFPIPMKGAQKELQPERVHRCGVWILSVP